ncbi:hypothetical protein BKA93DRAFT_828041 [Sparassis latifolia]
MDVVLVHRIFCQHLLLQALSTAFTREQCDEPLSVAVHAIANIAGLLCLAVVRALGALHIISVDIVPLCLEFAKQYATMETYLPLKPESNESKLAYSERNARTMKEKLGIKECGPKSIDFIIDASGAEVSIQTSDYPLALALVSQGKIDLKPLVTHSSLSRPPAYTLTFPTRLPPTFAHSWFRPLSPSFLDTNSNALLWAKNEVVATCKKLVKQPEVKFHEDEVEEGPEEEEEEEEEEEPASSIKSQLTSPAVPSNTHAHAADHPWQTVFPICGTPPSSAFPVPCTPPSLYHPIPMPMLADRLRCTALPIHYSLPSANEAQNTQQQRVYELICEPGTEYPAAMGCTSSFTGWPGGQTRATRGEVKPGHEAGQHRRQMEKHDGPYVHRLE